MGNLISKTVRLPTYLIDFIEEQEGGTFSEKLLGILHECRRGESDLQIRLAHYKNQCARYERLYSTLVNDYSEARRVISHTEKYLDTLRRLTSQELNQKLELPEPKPRLPEDPDLIPGNLPFT